jgi:hypothetical protein
MSSQPGNNKSRSRKITDIDPKYLPPKPIGPDGKEIPWADDPKTRAWMMEYATNAKMREQEAKLEAKRHEEERRRMKEYEKQQRERTKLEQQARSKIPERQLQMLLTGERSRWSCCGLPRRAEFSGHAKNCQSYRGLDIEPGLNLLKQEYRTCKIIRLDDKTYNRLVDFAKDEETILELINRLLDIASPKKGQQPKYGKKL